MSKAEEINLKRQELLRKLDNLKQSVLLRKEEVAKICAEEGRLPTRREREWVSANREVRTKYRIDLDKLSAEYLRELDGRKDWVNVHYDQWSF